jgi:opacity protein-like surface antigen
MLIARPLVVLMLLSGSVPQVLSAQRPERTIYVSGGIGAAWTRLHCDICQGDRKLGFSVLLGAGVRVSPKLALGLEAGGWKKNETDVTNLVGTLLAVAHWYPAPHNARYFLKGGIGAASYKVDDRVEEGEDDADPIRSRMFAAQLGIGYQLRISSDLSVSPYLTLLGSLKADLEQGNNRIASASMTLIQLGLTIGWR